MRKWFPSADETFVFRNRVHPEKSIVILVPGGQEPQSVIIDGVTYEPDPDREELVRMYINVAERKRLEVEEEK